MTKNNPTRQVTAKTRRLAEGTATFGLLLLCVALVAPFAITSQLEALAVYKWIYAAGALIYTVARMVGVNDPADSLRVRRLRRMEFWAGMAFMVGACFWFYTEQRLPPMAGPLAVLRTTIMFTLAGALIQIIASWMIVARKAKEKETKN